MNDLVLAARILRLLEDLKARMPAQIPIAEVSDIIEQLRKASTNERSSFP